MVCDYNLFLDGAKGSSFDDTHSVVDPNQTGFKLESHPTGVTIQFSVNSAFKKLESPLVDNSLVGIFTTTGQTIEDKDGKAITVNKDFNGKSFKKPVVGPISTLNEGANSIVWDLKR